MTTNISIRTRGDISATLKDLIVRLESGDITIDLYPDSTIVGGVYIREWRPVYAAFVKVAAQILLTHPEVAKPCPDCGATFDEECHIDCSSRW
jgi:hypothetical protein